MRRPPFQPRPSLVALVMGAAVFALYVYTLQPSLAWGDGTRLQREAITGESFILAELVDVEFANDPYPFARLGVAAWDHPLYVMVGHLLVSSLPAVSSLWLVNLISAAFAAASLVVFYLLLLRNTNSWTASLLASLALALSHTFWWHAVTPEVYTLFSFLMLLALYYFDSYLRSGNFAKLAAAALFVGLGAANHLLAFMLLPAAAVYLLFAWLRDGEAPAESEMRMRLGASTYLILAIAFLVGFAPYWIQLLRILRSFPLNEVLGPAVGATFIRGSLATSPAEIVANLATYLMFLVYQFGPLGIVLGVFGWWQGRSRFPSLWRMSLILYVTYLLFGIVYGVSDQFAFFLAAHVFWAVAIGMGIAGAEAILSESRRRLLWALLILTIMLVPLVYETTPRTMRSANLSDDSFGIPRIGTGVRDGLAYYLTPAKRGDSAASDFALQALTALPEDAVIIAEWYTDTDEYFVLRYYAAVEGLRPDIEIIGWPLEDPFSFDPQLALAKVKSTIPRRPLFLASLSDEFYAAAQIVDSYCVVPEHGLYRVYPPGQSEAKSCLTQASVIFAADAPLLASP